MPANPVLVELLRGSTVESRHRGSIAVCGAKGELLKSWGDVSQLIRAQA